MPTRKTVYTLSGIVALSVIIFCIVMLPSSAVLEPIPEIGTIELAKGPHWDDSRKCLFFVDENQSKIHKYVPSTKTHTSAKVVTDNTALFQFVEISFIIPISGTSDKFIVSFGLDLGIVTWDGNSTTAAYRTLVEVPGANEAKVSPSGSLFVGTSLGLRVFDKNGTLRRVPNILNKVYGMAWSADESTFYVTDYVAFTVSSYAYDKNTDKLTDGTVLLNYTKESLEGFPAGMAIDNDGKLWIASFLGASVLHFDPKTRKILNTINLDAYQITSVAFGGSKLTDMYVTTGRSKPDDSNKYLHSGYIFEQKASSTVGRPSTSFKMDKIP